MNDSAAHARLRAACSALCGATPHALRTLYHEDWASAGSVGERHGLSLILSGADAPAQALRLAETLPDHEFALTHEYVATIMVRYDPATASLQIEALTIDAD